MKNILAVLGTIAFVVVFALLLFLFFSFFMTILAIVCVAGLVSWACGAKINVTVTGANGLAEKRVYRWFSRIK